MYNYGSPRVGNRKFAEYYNKRVPDSFRVIVDGDIVPTLPFSLLAYKHVSTLVVVDAEGFGSIIIDPSDVEKKLRTRSKTSANYHQLIFYKNALEGVKKSLETVGDENNRLSKKKSKKSPVSNKKSSNAVFSEGTKMYYF